VGPVSPQSGQALSGFLILSLVEDILLFVVGYYVSQVNCIQFYQKRVFCIFFVLFFVHAQVRTGLEGMGP
jgi:hypothetical protein